MSVIQKQVELTRRRSILALLLFASGQTMTSRSLRDELEAVHGLVATVDRVRADVLWLADIGLVKSAADAATLTEQGREVVLDRAAMPGSV